VIDSRRGDQSVLHNSDFEDLGNLSSEGLVKYAKKLETKIDSFLERYDEDTEDGGVFFGNLRQIQESLNQLSLVVDQMNVKRVTAHTVQYHSEKLHHFMRTFQRVKDKAEEKRNREVLFGDYK
jgi:DNA replicative helicase MCM subunit Mcm2 (Cdc46/Mcm family)